MLGKSAPKFLNVRRRANQLFLDMGYIEVDSGEETNNEFVRTPIQATEISGGGKSKSCKTTHRSRSVISSLALEKDDNDNRKRQGISFKKKRFTYNLHQKALLLKMSLHGSEEKAIHAQITFFCDDIEYVRYRGDDEGVHSFSWATPQGCPVMLRPKPSSSSPDFAIMQESIPEGGDKEPSEAEGGDDELLPHDNGRARRRIALIVVAFMYENLFFPISQMLKFANLLPLHL